MSHITVAIWTKKRERETIDTPATIKQLIHFNMGIFQNQPNRKSFHNIYERKWTTELCETTMWNLALLCVHCIRAMIIINAFGHLTKSSYFQSYAIFNQQLCTQRQSSFAYTLTKQSEVEWSEAKRTYIGTQKRSMAFCAVAVKLLLKLQISL